MELISMRVNRHTDYVRGLCATRHATSSEAVGLVTSSWDRSLTMLTA